MTLIDNKKLPDWLIVSVWRSLLGEIYPSIRAIAIGLFDEKLLSIVCYLDHPPTEEDKENMDIVATNISASVTFQNKISNIDVLCQYSQLPFKELDSLDGFIYCRREYIAP
jgi:hypothetical protein